MVSLRCSPRLAAQRSSPWPAELDLQSFRDDRLRQHGVDTLDGPIVGAVVAKPGGLTRVARGLPTLRKRFPS